MPDPDVFMKYAIGAGAILGPVLAAGAWVSTCITGKRIHDKVAVVAEHTNGMTAKLEAIAAAAGEAAGYARGLKAAQERPEIQR